MPVARLCVRRPSSAGRAAAWPRQAGRGLLHTSTETNCTRPHWAPRRSVQVWAAASADEPETLAELKAALQSALDVEDYNRAARLRDAISKKQSDSRFAVEEANRQFYAAFMASSIKAMEQAWGKGDQVQVIHPGSNCIAGSDAVMESWRSILRNMRPGTVKIKLEDVRVYATESMGYVTCVEVFDADDSMGRCVVGLERGRLAAGLLRCAAVLNTHIARA